MGDCSEAVSEGGACALCEMVWSKMSRDSSEVSWEKSMVGDDELVDDALDDAEADEDNGGVDMVVAKQAGDVGKLGE